MDKLKPLEHAFKALFFHVVKLCLRRGETEFHSLDGSQLRRVLFLRPEKIGDMVISLPVFDGLRSKYPHIKISVLGSPRNYALIKDDPRFDRIFLYTKNIWKDVRTLIAMRREKFDCVIDMICDDSVTALMFTQLSAPGKPRIGVGKAKHRQYYDFNYDHRCNNTGHIIDNTLKLLEAIGIDSDRVNRYATPYIDGRSYSRADKFLSQTMNGTGNEIKIGYNLSAGSPTRIWSENRSTDLIEMILNHCSDCHVILLIAPQDRPRGRRIADRFDKRVILIEEGLSLIEASAVVSRLDMLITPDTSLVHIARSFKVDVVGMYSRFMKNYILWKPYGQELGAVVSNNEMDIHDLEASEVFDMFRRILAQQKVTVGK